VPPPLACGLPLQTRYAKHAEADANGMPGGFATPSRKVELYSQTFLDHGYPPLPDFEEAANRPGNPARSGGPLSASPDQREADAVLPKASTARYQACANARPIRKSNSTPPRAAGARHRGGRLGGDRDAGGQRGAPAPGSTTVSTPASRSASTAGGKPCAEIAHRATTLRAGRRQFSNLLIGAPRSIR